MVDLAVLQLHSMQVPFSAASDTLGTPNPLDPATHPGCHSWHKHSPEQRTVANRDHCAKLVRAEIRVMGRVHSRRDRARKHAGHIRASSLEGDFLATRAISGSMTVDDASMQSEDLDCSVILITALSESC